MGDHQCRITVHVSAVLNIVVGWPFPVKSRKLKVLWGKLNFGTIKYSNEKKNTATRPRIMKLPQNSKWHNKQRQRRRRRLTDPSTAHRRHSNHKLLHFLQCFRQRSSRPLQQHNELVGTCLVGRRTRLRTQTQGRQVLYETFSVMMFNLDLSNAENFDLSGRLISPLDSRKYIDRLFFDKLSVFYDVEWFWWKTQSALSLTTVERFSQCQLP